MSGKSEQTADRTAVLSRADVPVMVRRYLEGESMQVLAKECGKTRRTIYNWFLSELGDENYRELVTQALVARVADADEELEDARLSKDPVRVAAARETCRFVRMDLERRRPALYGPKQEVRHSGVRPTLNIVLLSEPTGGHLIEGTQVKAVQAVPALENKGDRDEAR